MELVPHLGTEHQLFDCGNTGNQIRPTGFARTGFNHCICNFKTLKTTIVETMLHQELNPAGNFGPWESSKLKELKKHQFSDDLGQTLLFENDSIRVWEIFLQPGERMGFRKITHHFSITSMCDALAVSRFSDGSIYLLKFNHKDTLYVNYEVSEVVQDLENISEGPLYLHLMEFKTVLLTYDQNTESASKTK